MNFINDILDSDQLCIVSDFIFYNKYHTMIWSGDGSNGKSTLCKTIPNSVFITLNSFSNFTITNCDYDHNSIFILSEMSSLNVQNIINAINHIRLHYKRSKLLIITNDSSLIDSLNVDNISHIVFKYHFVKHIKTSTDKLINHLILDPVDQLDNNDLWVSMDKHNKKKYE